MLGSERWREDRWVGVAFGFMMYVIIGVAHCRVSRSHSPVCLVPAADYGLCVGVFVVLVANIACTYFGEFRGVV